jgi:D-aminopeptidase
MVFAFDQTRPPEATEKKPAAMRVLTLEVNACVDGILAADRGAEVVALDGHGAGGINDELVHPRAELIAGHGLRAPCLMTATAAP